MSDLSPRILILLSDLETEQFLVPEDLEWLRALPGAVFVGQAGDSPEDWARLLLGYRPEVLLCSWSAPGLPGVLLRPENAFLKYVCYLAGSVRWLVPREFIAQGLLVTNWGRSISRTVAESCLLLTLMALRRSAYWSVKMHREGAWKDDATYTESLFGRRVGIHGFGAIAQALAGLLRPFEVEISAYSPDVPDAIFAGTGVTRAASLDELFAHSDVLVELAPLTPETRHLVDERLLRLLPEGAVFVNSGRGAVTDQASVLKLALEGRLQIALDVFDSEPLAADSAFRGLPNVTLMPHLGGPTTDRRRDAGRFAISNLRRYLAGQPLEALIDLYIYDHST